MTQIRLTFVLLFCGVSASMGLWAQAQSGKVQSDTAMRRPTYELGAGPVIAFDELHNRTDQGRCPRDDERCLLLENVPHRLERPGEFGAIAGEAKSDVMLAHGAEIGAGDAANPPALDQELRHRPRL